MAVPLSILTKSSRKMAEFDFERILREKHAKTVEFTRKFGICFNCYTIREKLLPEVES
jgi:hypothetical protein